MVFVSLFYNNRSPFRGDKCPQYKVQRSGWTGVLSISELRLVRLPVRVLSKFTGMLLSPSLTF